MVYLWYRVGADSCFGVCPLLFRDFMRRFSTAERTPHNARNTYTAACGEGISPSIRGADRRRTVRDAPRLNEMACRRLAPRSGNLHHWRPTQRREVCPQSSALRLRPNGPSILGTRGEPGKDTVLLYARAGRANRGSLPLSRMHKGHDTNRNR
jgi:hypothetical protein